MSMRTFPVFMVGFSAALAVVGCLFFAVGVVSALRRRRHRD